MPDSLSTALTMSDLNYAPLTDDERQMLTVDAALTTRMESAMSRGDRDILDDLLDEKIAIEKRFQESRARTWHVWMSEQFPEAMAQYSGRRPA